MHRLASILEVFDNDDDIDIYGDDFIIGCDGDDNDINVTNQDDDADIDGCNALTPMTMMTLIARTSTSMMFVTMTNTTTLKSATTLTDVLAVYRVGQASYLSLTLSWSFRYFSSSDMPTLVVVKLCSPERSSPEVTPAVTSASVASDSSSSLLSSSSMICCFCEAWRGWLEMGRVCNRERIMLHHLGSWLKHQYSHKFVITVDFK